MVLIMKQNIVANPINASLLGAVRVVLELNMISDLVKGFSRSSFHM